MRSWDCHGEKDFFYFLYSCLKQKLNSWPIPTPTGGNNPGKKQFQNFNGFWMTGQLGLSAIIGLLETAHGVVSPLRNKYGQTARNSMNPGILFCLFVFVQRTHVPMDVLENRREGLLPIPTFSEL